MHDLCVVKFIAASSSVSELYRRYGDNVPRNHRPTSQVYEDCLDARLCDGALTDELLDRICLHWQKTSVIRKLYLDPAISAEYEAFWNYFAREDIVAPRPGFTALGDEWLHTDSPAPLIPTFKARFRKTLCLNTLTTLSCTLAKAIYRPTPQENPDEKLLSWTNGHIILSNLYIPLPLQTCLTALNSTTSSTSSLSGN